MLRVDLSSDQIDREGVLRASFVDERLGHRPEYVEAMDLTRFQHGGPARLLACEHCGALLRDERLAAHYETDVYDPALMSHLYPRYLRAFEEKKSQYEPLLRDRAEVLEVGSHLGAFLEAAENWGWHPIGLDIGKSTSSFAKLQGGSVKQVPVEDYSPKCRPQAIFIWNCFEQLDDPLATLKRSHQLLDRHGILVIRVPNADFYHRQRHELEAKRSRLALKLLGYNNLLGFPYLHGFGRATLEAMLRANRFEPLHSHSSSLLTPPYPQMSQGLRTEWREVRRLGERDVNNGPWIELVSRRI